MNRTVLVIGIAIAAVLVGVLFLGLGKNPAEIRSPLIGKPAPTFALREVGTGRTVDVSTLKGKPVVINFWATWCGPCWEEHPVLVANARRLQPNVQFLGVVFDDTEQKILSFLQQRGSGYPTLVDEKGKTAIAYGVGGVPESFVLDASGTIVAKFNGPMSTDDLQENLQKAYRQ
jgi:cytochrome c biogenesis protein CcmG/thiol:disulfide interchange protein DsbE